MKNLKAVPLLIFIIGSFITMVITCTPKPGPQSKLVPTPDTTYLVPANDIAQGSYAQSNDSTNSLASESIDRNELINLLQGMDSTSTHVTFQFIISSDGRKHLAVYQTKDNFTPSDSMWIFSNPPTKCPPTCGYYSVATLDTAKISDTQSNGNRK